MATFTITGAFGYSGSYITEQLLAAGHSVRTLTGSPRRTNAFGDAVQVFPLDFDHPEVLTRACDGADVLVNTYWVRFAKAGFSQVAAVRNTKVLFAAAARAGIGRVVHVSITNPSLDSPYEYFRGKAELETALQQSGLPHTILRPAVLFGGPDILLNNIAWLLRRFPVFGLFGDGRYRLQPIMVEDFAGLVVRESALTGDRIVDAIGPETYTYADLVRCIGRAIGCERRLLRLPRSFGLAASKVLGWCLRDVLVTAEEIDSFMDDLLVTDSPPAGTTKLSEWLPLHAAELGVRYANELARRRDRETAYAEL